VSRLQQFFKILKKGQTTSENGQIVKVWHQKGQGSIPDCKRMGTILVEFIEKKQVFSLVTGRNSGSNCFIFSQNISFW